MIDDKDDLLVQSVASVNSASAHIDDAMPLAIGRCFGKDCQLLNLTGAVDTAVVLFAHIYSHVPNKHRLQMCDHFNECIKAAKGMRQQAVGMH